MICFFCSRIATYIIQTGFSEVQFCDLCYHLEFDLLMAAPSSSKMEASPTAKLDASINAISPAIATKRFIEQPCSCNFDSYQHFVTQVKEAIKRWNSIESRPSHLKLALKEQIAVASVIFAWIETQLLTIEKNPGPLHFGKSKTYRNMHRDYESSAQRIEDMNLFQIISGLKPGDPDFNRAFNKYENKYAKSNAAQFQSIDRKMHMYNSPAEHRDEEQKIRQALDLVGSIPGQGYKENYIRFPHDDDALKSKNHQYAANKWAWSKTKPLAPAAGSNLIGVEPNPGPPFKAGKRNPNKGNGPKMPKPKPTKPIAPKPKPTSSVSNVPILPKKKVAFRGLPQQNIKPFKSPLKMNMKRNNESRGTMVPSYPVGSAVQHPAIQEKTQSGGEKMFMVDTVFQEVLQTAGYQVPTSNFTILFVLKVDPDAFTDDPVARQDFDRFVKWRIGELNLRFESNVPSTGRGNAFVFYDANPDAEYFVGQTVNYNVVKNTYKLLPFSFAKDFNYTFTSPDATWLFTDADTSSSGYINDIRFTSAGYLVIVYVSGMDNDTAAIDLGNLYLQGHLQLSGRHFDDSLSTHLHISAFTKAPYNLSMNKLGSVLANSTGYTYSIADLSANCFNSTAPSGVVTCGTEWATGDTVTEILPNNFLSNGANNAYVDCHARNDIFAANMNTGTGQSKPNASWFAVPPGDYTMDIILFSQGLSGEYTPAAIGTVTTAVINQFWTIYVSTPGDQSDPTAYGRQGTFTLIRMLQTGGGGNTQTGGGTVSRNAGTAYPQPVCGWANPSVMGFTYNDPSYSLGGINAIQIRLEFRAGYYGQSQGLAQSGNLTYFDVQLQGAVSSGNVYTPIDGFMLHLSRTTNDGSTLLTTNIPDVIGTQSFDALHGYVLDKNSKPRYYARIGKDQFRKSSANAKPAIMSRAITGKSSRKYDPRNDLDFLRQKQNRDDLVCTERKQDSEQEPKEEFKYSSSTPVSDYESIGSDVPMPLTQSAVFRQLESSINAVIPKIQQLNPK